MVLAIFLYDSFMPKQAFLSTQQHRYQPFSSYHTDPKILDR